MAMAKKPGVTVVMGVGKPMMGHGDMPEETDSGEAHEEAADTLKSALEDAGLDVSDTLMSALHQYVEACIKHPPPAEEEAEGEEY